MHNYLGVDLLFVVQSVGVGEPVNTLFMLWGESLHSYCKQDHLYLLGLLVRLQLPENTSKNKDLLTGLVFLSMLMTPLRSLQTPQIIHMYEVQ